MAVLARQAEVPLARGSVVRMQVRGLHAAPIAMKNVSFLLADIGEGIAEAEVLQWYVKTGDKVKQFDQICEVQSDKATVEITSRYDGVITKLHYNVNDMAAVGKPLVDIEVADGTAAPAAAAAAPEAAAPAPTATTQPKADANGKVLMTPAVRRLVREHNVDLSLVAASGKDGRVLKEDVLRFIQNGAAAPASKAPAPAATPAAPACAAAAAPKAAAAAAAAPSPAAAPAAPAVTRAAEDKVVPVRGIKKMMVKSMAAALKVPHFGYADEIVMDGIMDVRTHLAAIGKARGVKITYMPIIIKAASMALVQHPDLNSHVNDECTEITYKAAHNIGVAMDTPQGLLVPNIKNVQDKSILEIASELNRLQALGKDGKLGPSDLAGGTFTLSNIGIIGGTYLSPVVVVPEVAIGALGKIQKVPRYNERNEVVPAHIMQVSFSADHRVLDGVTVAKFSQQFKAYLENPATLLLDMK